MLLLYGAHKEVPLGLFLLIETAPILSLNHHQYLITLSKLKKLLDAGPITKEDAGEKRKAILDSL